MNDYDRMELARWAFYNIGATMRGPTFPEPLGPVQWLEPVPATSGRLNAGEQERLFAPVDVMRGQMGLGL